MVRKIHLFFLLLITILFYNCSAQEHIVVGAEQSENYLPILKDQKIALMVNQSSMNGNVHLVDFLLAKNIIIQKIFAVEHGFRGNAANGEGVNDSLDLKTGIPIESLYGKKKKPNREDLQNIDIVIFDIQDVGCRFYTYISSLYYLMEACAENDVKLLVLDRPNPNGDYVDGPVLDMQLKSFVGLLPIPVVHGCTVGELAQMVNGEGWLPNNLKCNVTIIPVKNYTHSLHYSLPIKPSPNLPNDLSIRLYPSLCFFEATNVSIGRGTEFPFQVIGYPNCELGNFSFTPKTIKGVSTHPIFEDEKCTGIDLRQMEDAPHFTLKYFIQFANEFNDKAAFWKSKRWIELLSGSSQFYDQINNGLSEQEIRQTWQPELNEYTKMRKSYLLYPDFN